MTQTMHAHDSRLKEAVAQELRWSPSVDSTKIGVSVVDGTVTLSGEVDTYPQKLMASKAAQRVRGVVAIAQEITVSDTWRDVSDSEIATQVSDSLERNIEVPGTVKAAVQNHVITLSGAVEWEYQRAAANRSVQNLRGVRSIHDLITLKPKIHACDLQASIRTAIVRHAQLDSRNITVTLGSPGAVVLHGHVGTWGERMQAENVCWAAPGITHVNNELRVSP